LVDWNQAINVIVEWTRNYTYPTVTLAALAEGVGLPVPVGVLLALVGTLTLSGTGGANFILIIVLFTVANTAGNLATYSAASSLHRLLPRFTTSKAWGEGSMWDRAMHWERRYGDKTLFMAMLLGRSVRFPLMVAAGLARLEPRRYLAWCGVGNLLWGSFWLVAGSRFGGTAAWLMRVTGWGSKGLLVLGGIAFLLVAYLVVRNRRGHTKEKGRGG